jgi:hypothetical protein
VPHRVRALYRRDPVDGWVVTQVIVIGRRLLSLVRWEAHAQFCRTTTDHDGCGYPRPVERQRTFTNLLTAPGWVGDVARVLAVVPDLAADDRDDADPCVHECTHDTSHLMDDGTWEEAPGADQARSTSTPPGVSEGVLPDAGRRGRRPAGAATDPPGVAGGALRSSHATDVAPDEEDPLLAVDAVVRELLEHAARDQAAALRRLADLADDRRRGETK